MNCHCSQFAQRIFCNSVTSVTPPHIYFRKYIFRDEFVDMCFSTKDKKKDYLIKEYSRV